MKGMIKPGMGGYFAYFWDDEKKEWVTLNWFFTRFGAKMAIKRVARKRDPRIIEVFEV